jgi:hypothetical protein
MHENSKDSCRRRQIIIQPRDQHLVKESQQLTCTLLQTSVYVPADSAVLVYVPADSAVPVYVTADSAVPVYVPADSAVPVYVPADTAAPVLSDRTVLVYSQYALLPASKMLAVSQM